MLQCPALAIALVAALSAQAAEQEFPRKTIRLVATSSPGSPVDLFARAISDYLARALRAIRRRRQSCRRRWARSPRAWCPPRRPTQHADGQHLAQVVAPFMYSNLPFDMIRDFAGVAPLAIQPNVLGVAAAQLENGAGSDRRCQSKTAQPLLRDRRRHRHAHEHQAFPPACRDRSSASAVQGFARGIAYNGRPHRLVVPPGVNRRSPTRATGVCGRSR